MKEGRDLTSLSHNSSIVGIMLPIRVPLELVVKKVRGKKAQRPTPTASLWVWSSEVPIEASGPVQQGTLKAAHLGSPQRGCPPVIVTL